MRSPALHGALLPERHGLLAHAERDDGRRRLPLQLELARRAAHPEAGQHRDGAVRLHHPDLGAARARRPAPSLYGHGLLGSASEVARRERRGDGVRARHDVLRHRLVGSGRAATSPTTSPRFRTSTSSRTSSTALQQGVLNTLYLGRLMRTPDGFASDPAFQNGAASRCSTRSHRYYDGNSQGGIMGGMTTAVAPDFTRAALGVPGMNYGGLLLQRSTDFSALRDVPVRPRRRRLHRRLAPSADPRPDAAALGSRRGGRLCPAHDLAAAARHARSTRC